MRSLGLGLLLASCAGGPRQLTVERLTIVDAQGRPRVVLGTDGSGVERIAVATGLTLLDAQGAERGGFSVLADGSVVLGLDAPPGVGSPMRDRLALKVYPSGAGSITLIGNDTGIPVQLVSDAEGRGWLQFLTYDLERRLAFVKRLGFEGETLVEHPLGP